MFLLLFRYILGGFLLMTTVSAQRTKVTVANGTIEGVKCPHSDVVAFLSIPYAAPPQRFSAPKPYDAKYNGTGTLMAKTSAPTCPQFSFTGGQEDWYARQEWLPLPAPNKLANLR